MTEDKDVIAGEYALGLLEGAALDDARAREATDPGFAAEVERWRDQFASLVPNIPDEAPPEALEDRIMGALPSAAAPTPVPANDPGLWRPAAIAASISAVAMAGLLVFQNPVEAPVDPVDPAPAIAAAPLIASFTVTGFDQPRVAIYNEAAETLTMPGEMPIPDGHSAQLWAEIEGEAIALGTFGAVDGGVSATTTRALPAGTVLMISFEPEGQPVTSISGEVVAEGVLTAV